MQISKAKLSISVAKIGSNLSFLYYEFTMSTMHLINFKTCSFEIEIETCQKLNSLTYGISCVNRLFVYSDEYKLEVKLILI